MTSIGLRPTHTVDGNPIAESASYSTHEYAGPRRTSPQALTVLGLGIASVTVGWGLAAIAALVMARNAQAEIDDSDGELGGDSHIATGVLLAWISLAISAIFLLYFMTSFASIVDSGPSDGPATFYSPEEFEAKYGLLPVSQP